MNDLEKVPTFTLLAIFGGIVTTILLLWALSSLRRKRKKRLARRKQRHAEPVPSRNPRENPSPNVAERGLDAIKRQHTVTRKLLLPIIVLFFGLLGAIPYASAVPAATLSLLAAVFAVLFGIAVRPVLENVFAGLTLANSRLLSIGDVLRLDDAYGTVEDISATHTVIRIWNSKRYIISNSVMLNRSFENLSLVERDIWTEMSFWVDPRADLEDIYKQLKEATLSSEYFAGYEDPKMWIAELDKDGTRCLFAAWATSPASSWELGSELRASLHDILRKDGVGRQLQTWQRI